MKSVVLVIGHSKDSEGACNKKHRECEFTFNQKLVNVIDALLAGQPIITHIVYRDLYETLPEDINKLNPDFIISFHCNAYNKKTSGTETLYWHSSRKGRKIADIVQDEILHALNLPNRGSKPVYDGERGNYVLKETKAPCVITEPFFIDNDEDYEKANNNFLRLVMAYISAIHKAEAV
jgi:N-acetylmuramoyl-L-alanine amidase